MTLKTWLSSAIVCEARAPNRQSCSQSTQDATLAASALCPSGTTPPGDQGPAVPHQERRAERRPPTPLLVRPPPLSWEGTADEKPRSLSVRTLPA